MIKSSTGLTLACLLFISVNTYASGENTISAGYAQSHVKAEGESLDDNPKGFNLKYRHEMNTNWGMIGSFSYTNQSYDYYYGKSKVANGDFDYYSLTTGPSYRFNEYVSLYGLLGIAHGKVEVSAFGLSESESKTSIAYGAGLQFNPYPNIAIDASYEYSKLSDVKVGTWVVGIGYRF